MKIQLLEALSLINLSSEEFSSLLSLEPRLENGAIVYKSKDKRHKATTTPGRFLKRNVPTSSSAEVKLFAEMLTTETNVVITNDLEEIKKAYTEVNSCMSNHKHLLHIYTEAGLSLAVSYIGDKVIGRMLVDTHSKKCNTGYGNFIYLSRHLLLDGYSFTEQWLEGVAFQPISEGRYMYLPYLDTPSKLKLLEDKFVVSVDGEYVIQPKTNRVVAMKPAEELFPFGG